MSKLITKITALFYLAGLVLLFLAAKTWFANLRGDIDRKASESEKIEAYLAVREAFNFDELIESKEFAFFEEKIEIREDKILALYVLTTDACTPCLSELFRYSELLDDLGLAGKPVQHLAIIIDSEESSAERFFQTTDLSIPAGYCKEDGKYAEFLQMFHQFKTSGQLILIDNKADLAFFRAVISTTYGASDNERLRMLYAAEKAYDRR